MCKARWLSSEWQDNRQGPEPLSILFLLLPLLYVEEEEGINVARAQRDGGGEISRLNSEVWGGGAWWSAIYAIGYQAPHRLEYFNEHRECQIFLSKPKYTSVYRALGSVHYGVVLVNNVIWVLLEDWKWFWMWKCCLTILNTPASYMKQMTTWARWVKLEFR